MPCLDKAASSAAVSKGIAADVFLEVGRGMVARVVPPDAGAAGEARGGRGASDLLLEQLRGDWAEMRVLQWFHGVRPHQVLFKLLSAITSQPSALHREASRH